jgi:hypothetical protein
MSPERDVAKAEAYFQRSLAVARQQQARSWELRAAMSVARHWRDPVPGRGSPRLHASLMARLDRLGPAKEVAQIGAAIGREFSYALLAAVVNKPETELEFGPVCCSARACRRMRPVCANGAFFGLRRAR